MKASTCRDVLHSLGLELDVAVFGVGEPSQ